ncbi:MAG: 1-aminocyclopropane-1-carboxylate deaminase/D-cysteine desulfhydrase [Methyloprofundus sp.]|nr:1-aminocyclopropane-1-carboxylate deaminase/D-cysteine desulfhydrase [Methyloprofundus sp.]MBW6452424.1 pyridoxal-phosphate dependent enzyme [Methyloprofundus sp.]
MTLTNKQLIALEKSLGVSSLTQIIEPFIQEQGIELYLKRDDFLHPIISGNKWRKLKYILEHALTLNTQKIISMGGAYSNHLHALAYVGKLLGIRTEARIRGERPEILNSTLSDMLDWGMHLEFVSRSDYRLLRKYKAYDALPGLQKGEYWLPEGGAMDLALLGVAELVAEIGLAYDVLCVPCGTATTLAGLVSAAPNKQVLGFAALKGAEYLNQEVNALLKNTACHNNEWFIQLQYHFGGFAKIKPELLHFIRGFEQAQCIKLEPIYTGKMLYGIYDLISQGYFKSGQKIIAIHTGGLQGNRGFSS